MLVVQRQKYSNLLNLEVNILEDVPNVKCLTNLLSGCQYGMPLITKNFSIIIDE